ncbi:helix-turn-helix transcriptional regulator [Oribacterium sp. oral taxon 102]|uniref:helix-turn-helix domain-containing protein n=1 Tax=Oribacterium sp. oral taxon 102 TaxID=671214 RepID=UPI0015BA36F4|nr:helix-turn-helix transcriptional regulator [Oribacterium sp. oral taxon 102]NWO21331.1 helix-turn-helix transcriptional regulator [Oribacterium sp. oral taxon 102]
MCLSKNIRYLRRKYNLSQDNIASRLGYKSYTTIQKWEMGISEPSIAKLRELAKIFNVDINDMTSKDIEELERLGASENTYYTNPDTAKTAQEIFDNKELRVLFDAARDADPNDLKVATELLKSLKERALGLNNDD